jgi:hypothetical protein
MQLQTERMRAQLEKDRHELRHSLFWVQVLKRDLVEMREDLSKNDPKNHRNVVMRELKLKLDLLANDESKEDTAINVSQNLRELGLVAQMKMDEEVSHLIPEIENFEIRLNKFEDLLTQAMRKMDTLQTGADTRQDITDTQRRLAGAGIAHNMPQLLAREINEKKVKLKSITPTPQSAIVPSLPINNEEAFLANQLAQLRAKIAGDEYDGKDDDDEFDF